MIKNMINNQQIGRYKYDSHDHQKIGKSSHEFGNGSHADDGIHVSINAISNSFYLIRRPGCDIRRAYKNK